MIGLPILLHENMWTDLEIDTWMWKFPNFHIHVRAIPFLGIHKWDFHCSAFLNKKNSILQYSYRRCGGGGGGDGRTAENVFLYLDKHVIFRLMLLTVGLWTTQKRSFYRVRGWRGKGSVESFARARICKRFRSLGIDSKELSWRAGTSNRVVVAAGNRFLGSLKCLQIRVLCTKWLMIQFSVGLDQANL